VDVEHLIAASRRALKLVWWYQLLVHGMYRILLRLYGAVWTSAVLVLAGSLVMLAASAPSWSRLGPFWLWLVICGVLLGSGYLIERTVGVLPLVMVSIVLPATLVINPLAARPPGHAIAEEDVLESLSYLATGDLECFGKGAAVFLGLGGLATVAYAACRSSGWLVRRRHWPPRRPVVAALLVAGLVALEMLRIATRSWPNFTPPWYKPVSHFLSAEAWPYAICLWIWLEVACLLGVYDSRVLPHLLHRIGQDWAPRRLSLHDVYLVDQLLTALAHAPAKGTPRTKLRTRRGYR
jgi:hypothetical protein